MQNEAILCAFLAPIRNNPPGRARDPENKKRRLVNCLSRTVTPFLPDYDSLRITMAEVTPPPPQIPATQYVLSRRLSA